MPLHPLSCRQPTLLLVAALSLLASAARAADHAPHWAYSGHHGGPAQWAELDPKFEACAQGQRQSPIDIRNAVKAELPPLRFDYGSLPATWTNNGHTVQLNLPEGATLAAGERRFSLLQFHFHTPSEEAVMGKRYDMVAHFVHKDAQGQLGVVAVLFKRGPAHAGWGQVLAHLPRPGEQLTVDGPPLDLAALLPAQRGYYSFDGSLTTPPCSEGVSWMVLKTPVTVSAAQLASFRQLYAANARPLQPGHGREIRQSID